MSSSNVYNIPSLTGKQDDMMFAEHWTSTAAAPNRAKFSALQTLKKRCLSEGSSTRDAKQPLDLPASCAAGVQFTVQQLRIDPPLLSPPQRLQIRSGALLMCEASSTWCEQVGHCCCDVLQQRSCSYKVLSNFLVKSEVGNASTVVMAAKSDCGLSLRKSTPSLEVFVFLYTLKK